MWMGCAGNQVFYAAEMWGSWAVIFQQIYNLHSTTDDVPSRAPYTRRVSLQLLKHPVELPRLLHDAGFDGPSSLCASRADR